MHKIIFVLSLCPLLGCATDGAVSRQRVSNAAPYPYRWADDPALRAGVNIGDMIVLLGDRFIQWKATEDKMTSAAIYHGGGDRLCGIFVHGLTTTGEASCVDRPGSGPRQAPDVQSEVARITAESRGHDAEVISNVVANQAYVDHAFNVPTSAQLLVEQQKRHPAPVCPYGSQPPMARPGCHMACINGQWAEVCN